MDGFMTPPDHVGFLAKKLFGNSELTLKDGSVAYLAPGGGGPQTPHTHEHDHLFIVIKGEAKLLLGDKTVFLHENEAYLVDGRIAHAVFNNAEGETVMIGLTTTKK